MLAVQKTDPFLFIFLLDIFRLAENKEIRYVTRTL
jgi:hypothetical protein